MRVVVDLTKSIEENASLYYDKAKKAKKKLLGAEEALARAAKQLKELAHKDTLEQKQRTEKPKPVKREWYEKFRWFISSEGFLVIGGRDATSNEMVIKKHTDDHDIVFHTDMAGSPFFVVKTERKKPRQTLREVADATVTFSRAWKQGRLTTEVFYVTPEQVSKKTKAGEYMPKGAFMIYGKTTYVDNAVNLAVGMYEEKIMAGPVTAIKKHCKKYVVLMQGNEKASAIAKKIQHKIGGNLDDIIRALPAGMFTIKAS